MCMTKRDAANVKRDVKQTTLLRPTSLICPFVIPGLSNCKRSLIVILLIKDV